VVAISDTYFNHSELWAVKYVYFYSYNSHNKQPYFPYAELTVCHSVGEGVLWSKETEFFVYYWDGRRDFRCWYDRITDSKLVHFFRSDLLLPSSGKKNGIWRSNSNLVLYIFGATATYKHVY